MPRALGLVETRGLIGAIEAADAMVKAANVKLAGTEKTVPALITVKVLGDTAAVRSAVDAGAAAAERVGELYSTHIIPQPDEQLSVILPEISDDRNSVSSPKVPQKKSEKKDDESKPEHVEKGYKSTGENEGAESKKDEKKVANIEVEKKETEKSKPPADEQRKEELEDLFSKREKEDTIARLKREAIESSKKSSEIKNEKDDEEKETGSVEIPDDIEEMNVHDLRKLARSIDYFPIKGREISKANRQELLDYFDQLK